MAPLYNRNRTLNSKHKDGILRKLSPIESFQSATHLLGLYVGCVVSCRYHVPETLLASAPEPSFKSRIELAIAQAISQLPVFAVGRINVDTKKPLWVRLDRIDFNNHIKWQTVSETEDYTNVHDDALDWQVNTPYANLDTQPSWRSTIIRPANSEFIDVIFAWDHTAGDGKSGKLFQDTLLACLNHQTEAQDKVILQDRAFEVPVMDFTPPLHRLIKLPVSLNFILGEFGRDLIATTRPNKPPQTAQWAPVKTGLAKSRLLQIEVAKDFLRPILNACRQHETTLTGLLQTLLLVSIAARVDETKARAFECGTPVCLRQFQQPGTSNVDMNKTAINSVVYWPYVFDQGIVATLRQQISDAKLTPELNANVETTVWSAAKAIREGLSAKLKQGAKNDPIGLAKFITNWKSFLMDHTKSRVMSWEVSNLGVFNGGASEETTGSQQKWTVESAIFSQSASVSGPALTFSTISVKGGALVLSCSWQDGVVEDELAKGVSADIESWLNQLGANA
ncbi:alcohol acetyltransferase-domain-containing protein [Fusarium tricinctum]|uniref:Alcohol acetyltransferase-domain-containing protein n=1 Tax=Fusarium tricinctum TaxID=61284 RepID=A0A8K0WBR3_9HYPO|nr:alcohol acetyltransferase-domain-containing protein [Fusarium tricinctum]